MIAGLLDSGDHSRHAVSPATLVEALEYEPCDNYCGPFNHPTTAYCLDIDHRIVVGERAGLLWPGESDTASMRDLAGKQIVARLDDHSIWMGLSNERMIKIKRGSSFEYFTDMRCLIEVHRAKMALAAQTARPPNVPADAVAVAGEQVGNYRPVFVWQSCTVNAVMSTIDCSKWYPSGASRGPEHYCMRTIDGEAVSSGDMVDRLASREGHVVLASGAVLQVDHRGRINDVLMKPDESCR